MIQKPIWPLKLRRSFADGLVVFLMTSLVVMFLSPLMTGCSSSKLAYQWADDYIVWQADDYFDLNSEQKKQVRTETKAGLDHLRKESFAKFSDFLLETRDRLAQGQADPARLEAQLQDRAQRLQNIFDQSMASLAPFAKTASSDLTLKNWQNFRKEFETKTSELEKKGFDAEKYVDRLKNWMPLNNQQTKSLVQWLKENPFPYAQRLANRRHLLAVFEKQSGLEQNQLEPERVQKTIEAWPSLYQNQQLPEYTAALAAHRSRWLKQLAQLTYTDSQKKIFIGNLEDRARDLKKMSEEK